MFRLTRRLIRIVLFLFYRVTVTGLENIPQTGAAVICANHTFYKDLIVIGGQSKRRIRWFAKAELFRNPLVARFLNSLGAFPVNRGEADRNAIKAVYEVLKKGELLGIFPEGTRVKNQTERIEVKRGFVSFAANANVPIIPVAVSYQGGPFGRGKLFSRIQVTICKRVDFDSEHKYKNNELVELSNKIMDDIYNEV